VTDPGVNNKGVRPLRVLLATPYGQDGMGGIDRLNDAIADGFNNHPAQSGIRCARLVTRGKGSLWAAQAVFASALARLTVLAARREVDLLHIHLSVRGSSYRKAVLAKLARTLRIPYVVHLHGTDYKEFWESTNPILRSELSRMIAGSARFIVLGDFWARVMRDLQPDFAQKIVVLPNATAAAAPRQDTSDRAAPQITFLGQLGQRKGSADLLQALSRLQHLPNWTATLAGDGPIAETQQLVRKLGLDGRVRVPGWVGTAERTSLLQASDMLVLPSYAENLPMVILEAFANGVPVISTPVGAIPEVVVPERNGLLVKPGDVTGLANAIERLLKDTSLRHRMADAARRDHAEKYEMKNYLRRLSDLWHAALTEASPRHGKLNAHPSEVL
jgi:glycosyltransferase involved in cell wall biosynthesis